MYLLSMFKGTEEESGAEGFQVLVNETSTWSLLAVITLKFVALNLLLHK